MLVKFFFEASVDEKHMEDTESVILSNEDWVIGIYIFLI
jgi:hypothetical protein